MKIKSLFVYLEKDTRITIDCSETSTYNTLTVKDWKTSNFYDLVSELAIVEVTPVEEGLLYIKGCVSKKKERVSPEYEQGTVTIGRMSSVDKKLHNSICIEVQDKSYKSKANIIIKPDDFAKAVTGLAFQDCEYKVNT